MHRTTPHLRFETRYDHILTPLRQRGMPAAIEILGALIYIHAPLPDGSHLQITSDGTLPSDPDAVRAWQAYRHHDDNPTVSALIYDSTTDGEHRLECGLRSPLFAAIDAFLAARGLVPTWRSEFRPVAVHVRHQGLTGVLGRPLVFPGREQAAAHYIQLNTALLNGGWQRLLAHSSVSWPRSSWARDHDVIAVSVLSAEFAPSGWRVPRG